MTSLRQFVTNATGTYGSTEHPECLPGKEALKLARMAKGVDLLVQHPAPSVTVLADDLGVSRSTAYRMLADEAFQIMLRRALQGRMATMAKRALDQIEKTMDEGTPALQFKAATWLLERMDRLYAVNGGKSAEEWRQAQAEEQFLALMERMRRERTGSSAAGEPDATAPENPLQLAARASLLAGREAEDDLADAELLDPS